MASDTGQALTSPEIIMAERTSAARFHVLGTGPQTRVHFAQKFGCPLCPNQCGQPLFLLAVETTWGLACDRWMADDSLTATGESLRILVVGTAGLWPGTNSGNQGAEKTVVRQG